MTAISSWKRGDQGNVARVTITDDIGPVDLTSGYLITWQLRPSPNASTFVAVSIDDSNADSGVLLGTIPKETSLGMTPGVWVSDIEVTGESGAPYSSKTFEVEVLPDVSRPVVEVVP